MKFLKKSSPKVAVAPVEPPAPVKSATQSSDTIDVIIQINEKKSADQLIDVAEEGITIKVNNKAVSLEPSATSEEGQKFVDDLQQAVEEDATKKEEQQQAATSILGKLMFWKATEKSVKEEKKEETVVEEAQEQEQEEPVEEKEEAEPAAEAEVEAATEQEDSGPFGFLQNKLTFWQEEAAKEEKEEEPVSEELTPEEEVKPAEAEAETEAAAETEAVAEAETETEKKEVEDEVFGHKIEVFVDGVAIQTIRLTNSGMDHLKNFIASVQEEARLKGESVAVTKTWLAEKMSEFFESAKEQGNAEVSDETPAPSSVPAPVEEEKVAAEVDTQPSKSSWWPFSKAEEKAEETAVDEVRSETAEGVEVDATEHMREVAEAA
eukprot:CAMPEP_0113406056 /NCGR_PEP_ID=MMETSP0013_2-20120614/19296_1 /TAXON_ID=2843 ORGANISM="Skeletonema costatum, Strain 1716" /NCGR_SAMPLE_ID=MMETSP0013_2 /ASSEMBLY_ACC=CAM_ASM_000158 /LENGTH=377 /DNA_ID=CAMNT_0000291853 /DNA_START=62 /DNA_END=1195 /DNA_ORIENTATION=- /assembly_acc=CAM_ASM_000158